MTEENPFSETTDATIQLEGDRMSRLREAVYTALTRALKNCSDQHVEKCFPQLKRDVPQELTEATQRLRQHLEQKMMEEFDKIVKNRDLVHKLNELDTVIDEAKERESTGAPHPQLPIHSSTDMLAIRTAPVMKQELNRLEAIVTTTQSENDIILNEYKEKRKKMEECLQQLQSNVGSIVKISEQLENMEYPILTDMLKQV
ncbi:hypothetical protein BDF19DRAFT_466543 [Syncephalis fuscata]|nr:hypothetical protein BDF19DRAFT_466543 [Syncephalis fuscata]